MAPVRALAVGALSSALVSSLLLAIVAPPASAAVPSAPQSLSVAAGPGELVISWWVPASDGGQAITSYTATASVSGTSRGSCTTTGSTCDIEALTNGQAYDLSVIATNSDGAGTAATSTGTPVAVPSEPLHVLVSGSESGLLVQWSAPATDGGSAVLDYVAEAYSTQAGGSVAGSCSTASASERSCQIEPLTAGTAYYVSVYAQNATGNGLSSARVRAVAGSTPSVPRSVVVSRVTGGMSVHWLPPASVGSSAVTSYTARAYTSSSSAVDAVASCSTADLTCTITGVSSSTIYYVAVSASNATGEGIASTRVSSAIAGPPSAPRSVTVVRGNGYALVKWSSPASAGGSAITRYVARAYLSSTGGAALAECSPVASRLECNIGPLPNGGTYFIDVTATNHYSDGDASAPRVSVITATDPTAPREVSAVQSPSGILIQWRTPESDGGHVISSYSARAWSAATGGSITAECTTSGSQCVITSKSSAPVFVDVVAKSAVGSSTASAPRIPIALVEPVDAPRSVSVQAKGKSWVVQWQGPEDADSGDVLAYTAKVQGAETRECTVTPAAKRTVSSCSFPKTPGSTATTISVSARTSTAVTSSTPLVISKRTNAPGVPREVSGEPGAKQLRVEWVVPGWQGTSPVTGYRVRAWSKAKDGSVLARCEANATPTPGCLLTGVTDFEPVWVEVAASNGAGWGPSAARVRMEPRPSPPGNIPSVIVNTTSDGFDVSWSGTPYGGGYPIRGYVVRVTSDAAGETLIGGCSTKATVHSCRISNMAPGSHAWVSVAAVNTVGSGEAHVQEGTVPFS